MSSDQGDCGKLERLTPDGEQSLEDKPHWDPVEDGTETHGFTEVETSKDDPVGEPLLVIVGTWALDSLDREVGWESPSDEVGNGLS